MKIETIIDKITSDKFFYNTLKYVGIIFFIVGFISMVFWAFSTLSFAGMLFMRNKTNINN